MLTEETTDEFVLILTSLSHCLLMPRFFGLVLVDNECDDRDSFLCIKVSTSFRSSGMYISACDTVRGMLTFFCHKIEFISNEK